LPECTQEICKNVRTDFQEADPPPPLLHLVWKRAAMFYALPRAKGQGAGSAALPKRPVAHAGLESGCRTWPDLLHRTIERAARRPSGDEMTRSVPTALKSSYFTKASRALLLQEGFSRAGCPLVRARLRLKPARAELHSGYRQKLPT